MPGKKETPAYFAMLLQKARADLHRAAKSGNANEVKSALGRCDEALEAYRKSVDKQEATIKAKRTILDL